MIGSCCLTQVQALTTVTAIASQLQKKETGKDALQFQLPFAKII